MTQYEIIQLTDRSGKSVMPITHSKALQGPISNKSYNINDSVYSNNWNNVVETGWYYDENGSNRPTTGNNTLPKNLHMYVSNCFPHYVMQRVEMARTNTTTLTLAGGNGTNTAKITDVYFRYGTWSTWSANATITWQSWQVEVQSLSSGGTGATTRSGAWNNIVAAGGTFTGEIFTNNRITFSGQGAKIRYTGLDGTVFSLFHMYEASTNPSSGFVFIMTTTGDTYIGAGDKGTTLYNMWGGEGAGNEKFWLYADEDIRFLTNLQEFDSSNQSVKREIRMTSAGHFHPLPDITYDLGLSANRWRTVYAQTFIGTVSGDLSGNASTATKLATARTISATGDGTWSVSFDGSQNASAAFTLANSGATSGTYGSSTTSPSMGGTFSIPRVTVDAKGRVTAISNSTITVPHLSNNYAYADNTANGTSINFYMGGNGNSQGEKNIFFNSKSTDTNVHRIKIYGGNGTSTTTIGVYDSNISSKVWYYRTDTQIMYIPAVITLRAQGPVVMTNSLNVSSTITGAATWRNEGYIYATRVLLAHGASSGTLAQYYCYDGTDSIFRFGKNTGGNFTLVADKAGVTPYTYNPSSNTTTLAGGTVNVTAGTFQYSGVRVTCSSTSRRFWVQSSAPSSGMVSGDLWFKT